MKGKRREIQLTMMATGVDSGSTGCYQRRAAREVGRGRAQGRTAWREDRTAAEGVAGMNSGLKWKMNWN
jgi:hypothetical protein